jgi:hypothetical protein
MVGEDREICPDIPKRILDQRRLLRGCELFVDEGKRIAVTDS